MDNFLARGGYAERTASATPMLKCALEAPEACAVPGTVSEGTAHASGGLRAKPAEESEGGGLGNTPPASSQAGSASMLSTLSEDTIHACLWVDYGKREAELLQRFEAAKVSAAEAANRKYDEQTPDEAEEEAKLAERQGFKLNYNILNYMRLLYIAFLSTNIITNVKIPAFRKPY